MLKASPFSRCKNVCLGSTIENPGYNRCINVFQMTVYVCDLSEYPVIYGYSMFRVLNVTAGLYLRALPEKKY